MGIYTNFSAKKPEVVKVTCYKWQGQDSVQVYLNLKPEASTRHTAIEEHREYLASPEHIFQKNMLSSF